MYNLDISHYIVIATYPYKEVDGEEAVLDPEAAL